MKTFKKCQLEFQEKLEKTRKRLNFFFILELATQKKQENEKKLVVVKSLRRIKKKRSFFVPKKLYKDDKIYDKNFFVAFSIEIESEKHKSSKDF